MHGVYLLYWVQEKQMPAALVASILAAGDLAHLALEVPTGWVADRLGHRVSLIIGSAVQVLGMFFCWLGTGAPGLLAASLLVALGDAFRSGADHALMYRSAVTLGRESEFQRIESRTRAVQLGALVVLILVGGVVVRTWGYAAGWITEIALCSIGLGIACAMTEAVPAVPTDDAAEGGSSWASIRRSGRLMALMLPAAFLVGAGSGTAFFAQTGITDAMAVTWLVAFITLAEAVGAAAATRARRAGVTMQIVLGALGLAGLAAAMLYPPAFLPVVVALAFLQGVAHPLRAAAIQRSVDDRVRATAASAASACDMAAMMVALPLAGVSRQRRRQ